MNNRQVRVRIKWKIVRVHVYVRCPFDEKWHNKHDGKLIELNENECFVKTH